MPGRFISYEVSMSDTVEFVCRHESAFEWRGRIVARDGTITFDLDGHALSSFAANRIGFCVLHPIELAGQPVTALSAAGEVNSRFPARISPHQPFTDLVGLRYGGLRLSFSGDLFEMEDHRNWTDAGFKTYCTPLRVPYPVTYQPGDRVRQTVVMSAELEVVAGDEVIGRVPELGSSHVDLFAGPGATSPGPASSVAVFASGDTDWKDVAALLAPHREVLSRVAVFDLAKKVTLPGMASGLREALRGAGIAVPVGGGSGANFAELNRMSLPVTELDFVCYGVNPMVHHTDDESVMDTLLAQPHTLRDALFLAAGLPVIVGPIIPPRPALAEAWTIGSIAALVGAQALTYVRGLIPPLAGSAVHRVEAPARELAALAAGSHVWVANLRDTPRTVRVLSREFHLGPYAVATVPR
jgi:hypothetical protein